MSVAYIGLGSNVGPRENYLKQAVEMLDRTEGVKVTEVSSVYETAPVGYLNQPDFLNVVAAVEAALSPRELISAVKRIETALERKRDVRWGPRTVDLDILLYDDMRCHEPDLELPHPQVANRAFVLVPLAEIAPDFELPDGKKVKELLAGLGKVEGVRLYGQVGRDSN